MYTQCPECETTFRLGAEDLRRANGKVRCGDCGHVFNALEYLAEEVEEEATAAEGALADAEYGGWTDSSRNPDGDIEPDIDEYEASAYLEDEESTDEAGEALVDEEATDVFDDDEDEDEGGAILYIAGDDDHEDTDEDESDEEAVAEDESPADDEAGEDEADYDEAGEEPEEDFDESVWERIPGVGAALGDTEAGDWSSEDEATEEPEAWLAESDEDSAAESEADEDAEDWTSEDEPVHAGDVDADEDADAEREEAAAADDLEFNVPEDKWTNFFGPLPKGQVAAVWQPPQIGRDDDDEGDAWDEAAGGESLEGEHEASVEEETADELAAAEDDTGMPPTWQDEADTERSRTGLWLAGALVAAVALGSQMVHYNRDRLAAHPSYGDNIRSLYASLGSELYPEWSIDDYEIRGSEAVAGESGANVLDIRAQIAATGDNATGLPRLRVVLRDRWSNPVAANDFGAAEYADALPTGGLLQPGTVIDAHVSIQDPGQGAQGFELELCLPRRHEGLICTGQPFK